MPIPHASVYAVVEVTLKIRVTGSWGDECPMSQIRKQATESGIEKLRKATDGSSDFGIIGTPRVSATIVEPK